MIQQIQLISGNFICNYTNLFFLTNVYNEKNQVTKSNIYDIDDIFDQIFMYKNTLVTSPEPLPHLERIEDTNQRVLVENNYTLTTKEYPDNNHHYYLILHGNSELQNLILSLHEFDFPIVVYTDIKEITLNDIHELIMSRT